MKNDYDYIQNGDCLELMKGLPDNSIDLIVTDPPYIVSTENKGGTINNVKGLRHSLSSLSEKIDLTNGYDIAALSELVVKLQGDNINAYFFCSKAQIPEYIDVYVNKLHCKFDIITWHKPNALPTYANKYLTDTEYVLYFHKGKGKTFPKSYEDAKTYYIDNINHKDKKLYGHPSIKPIPLLTKLIRNSSNEGDVVLDPFLGSGSTCVAAIKEKRHYIGFEINNDYFHIAEKRISQELLQEQKIFE